MENTYKKPNWFKRTWKNIYSGINNCILCIRFPFLYAKNRFSGLHYTNYKLGQYIANLQKKSESSLWLHVVSKTDFKLEEYQEKSNVYKQKIDNKEYTYQIMTPLWEKGPYCILSDKNEFYCSFLHEDYFDIDPEYAVQFYNTVELCFVNNKNTDTTMLTFIYNEKYAKPKDVYRRFHTFIVNDFAYFWRKIVKFIYHYPLQWIFFWPKWTELDAMESGWRKKFGIQICKEIKSALIKFGGLKALYNYQIMQIKEKWGFLHWYDSASPESVQDIISKYERISAHTCIYCGKPAKYLSKGWISPYCEDCIDKNNPERYTLIKKQTEKE